MQRSRRRRRSFVLTRLSPFPFFQRGRQGRTLSACCKNGGGSAGPRQDLSARQGAPTHQATAPGESCALIFFGRDSSTPCHCIHTRTLSASPPLCLSCPFPRQSRRRRRRRTVPRATRQQRRCVSSIEPAVFCFYARRPVYGGGHWCRIISLLPGCPGPHQKPNGFQSFGGAGQSLKKPK